MTPLNTFLELTPAGSDATRAQVLHAQAQAQALLQVLHAVDALAQADIK